LANGELGSILHASDLVPTAGAFRDREQISDGVDRMVRAQPSGDRLMPASMRLRLVEMAERQRRGGGRPAEQRQVVGIGETVREGEPLPRPSVRGGVV